MATVVVRPRRAAWVGVLVFDALAAVAVLVGVGVVLAGDSSGFALIVMGVVIALLPPLYFFRAKVVWANGLISKKGLFGQAQSSSTDQLGSIEPYTKTWIPDTGGGSWTSEAYAVRRRDGTMVFELSTNWWAPKDIAELAQQLGIEISGGEAAEEQRRIALMGTVEGRELAAKDAAMDTEQRRGLLFGLAFFSGVAVLAIVVVVVIEAVGLSATSATTAILVSLVVISLGIIVVSRVRNRRRENRKLATMPAADGAFLTSRGYSFVVSADRNHRCVVIKDYKLPPGYDMSHTDLLLRLPSGFPDATPDVWWCDPPVLRLGLLPPNADAKAEFLGRVWQGWSHPLPDFAFGHTRSGLKRYLAVIDSDFLRGVNAPVPTTRS